MRPNEKPVSPFLFIHLPSIVDIQLYFGLVLARHAIHASSACPYPARIVIRCSLLGVRTPTSRAHIGRRKRLLCITAASSSSAYDAICAVHFGCVLFSVVVVVSFWFYHLALDPKQSIKKENKIDYIMWRMICARCESCMRCWMLNTYYVVKCFVCVSHCFAASLMNTHRREPRVA